MGVRGDLGGTTLALDSGGEGVRHSGHGSERRQSIDLDSQVVEFGAQVVHGRCQIAEGGGDRLQFFFQIIVVSHGHATRLS